ncbi:MAG: hypothetical protein ACP5O1_11285, partial [Phycisphaerae bacterium]
FRKITRGAGGIKRTVGAGQDETSGGVNPPARIWDDRIRRSFVVSVSAPTPRLRARYGVSSPQWPPVE